MVCIECGAENSRITPLLKPEECLKNHEQYICSSCGRCICIAHDEKRGLQRWNFPFRSLENAKLYLRTADYTVKKSCGIYELKSGGRRTYKIFADNEELAAYLKKNKSKVCALMSPVFTAGEYRDFPNAQVRRLTNDEAEKYMAERGSIK